MLDRRRLLLSAAATGVAGLVSGCATTSAAPKPAARPSPSAAAEEAKLNDLFDRIFQEQLKESPTTMTSLGLDTGEGAWARSKLDDQSAATIEKNLQIGRAFYGELKAIDRQVLSGMAAVNYDTLDFSSRVSLEGADRFHYGAPGYPAPYVLSQLSGAYQGIPDFLDSQHPVETREDAEAYLSRLAQFATTLDQETERARADAARGVIPPDFVIDRTLEQMKTLRGTPADKTTLVASLARRTAEKQIAGDWAGRARPLVEGPVMAALDRQIALLQSWRPNAVHDAGVWRLPDGEAYYRFGVKLQTTTDMAPDEIHALGLQLVGEISGKMDAIFRAQGMTQGTVGQRLNALYKDPKFIYPNTEAGKAQLLSDLNGLVKVVSAKLPDYFGTLPKAGLEIRRVPAAIEAGAPGGSYQPGTLDGSRPGAYYINLRDTAEVPRWTLPTLTYHEGVPGHHLQGTLALEAQGIPMLRKTMWFAGYGEGWALYAEQLADEMGMYENDPFGRIGYLHDALFRAVRLVVDSGMHAKRWSREQAVRYNVDTLGDPEASAITEIERYCVWPGQACSYMVGKMTWLRLREAAKAKLGPKFDIRGFHDAGLLAGAMPLEVLERVIGDWAASRA
ncbi:DUF885 family protein [Caulobacter sp. 17J80-11]|uniref:DUF885 domain-containing protein n=1 Tax=Caulobacter sp. 17J80-11 TaxID=2763502 RepID=UPI0016535DB6|nr:DUF885 family protein [Caulobacter sp. 17J80-11]MBC6982360.1 DUF885 family protein [Caulobacter sp. 17J80-11]